MDISLFYVVFSIKGNRLLKTAHLLRCAPTASLDVRKEYACARPFSRALHLDRFEQPGSRSFSTL
jgi:hypothetical protein